MRRETGGGGGEEGGRSSKRGGGGKKCRVLVGVDGACVCVCVCVCGYRDEKRSLLACACTRVADMA